MAFKAPAPPMVPARWHGGAQSPRAIVMHGTVSPCVPGGARSTAHFFATETNKTSAHYVVDCGPTDPVIQCVGDHVVAYHCGWNQGSIAVELCDPETGSADRWMDKAHTAMLGEAATLVAQLCLAYNIEPIRPTVAALKAKGPHGIYGHNDSRLAFGHTTHTDPIGFPWGKFLTAVKGEIARLSNPHPVPPPPKPKPPVDGRWQILASDGNLDLHKQAWRSYFREVYGIDTSWTGHMPKAGTHAGGRLIDFGMVWGADSVVPQILPISVGVKQPPALDHKAFRQVIDFGGTKVTHVHHSLDDQKAKGGDWKIGTVELVQWITTRLTPKADIVTLDECLQPKLAKALTATLNATGNVWTVRQQGEFICITRNAMFRPAGKVLAVVSKVAGLVGWRQMHVAYFRTDLRATGRKGRIVVTHEPAGVEYGVKWKPGAQTLAHQTGDHVLAANIKRWQGMAA